MPQAKVWCLSSSYLMGMCPRASVSVLDSGLLHSNTFQSKPSGLGKIKIFLDNIATRMNALQYSANEDMTAMAGR